MASTQAEGHLSEEIHRLYKEVLLDVVHRLENDQKEELRFYFSELTVPKEDKGALNTVLRSLQNNGKMSWKDLCALKDGLRVIQRWDLVNILTTYEVQRDVIILLDIYARKKQTSEVFYPQVLGPVYKVGKYLEYIVAEVVRSNKVEVANAVGSLMQSRLGIRKALANCEEEIEVEMSDPWSKLTLLVVIAGEMFAAVLANDGERSEGQQKREVWKTCSIMAEELSSRMIKLGNWEDFSNFVEKRFNLIYSDENTGLDADSLNSRRKIAEMIQLFKKSSFFYSKPKLGSRSV